MKAIEQKKLAVIKSNAAPEVKLKALEVLSNARREIKIESGNYKGNPWTMRKVFWESRPEDVIYTVVMSVETDIPGQNEYMAEEGRTPQEAMTKIKARADKAMTKYKAMKERTK